MGRPARGGPPTTLDPESFAARQVVALGDVEYTVRRTPLVPPLPGDHLTYRSPVTLVAGGSEKRLGQLLVEAPFGYRAEVRDGAGRRVAASAPRPPPRGDAGRQATVAVASQVGGAQATLGWVEGFLGPGSGSVTAITSPADVPDTGLLLGGLQALVIAGFDTGALTPAQIRAAEDYVALGGSLVLGGGAGGARTVLPLPDGLVPLHPTGTATAPLAAMADLAARTTAATATVVTGELRRGRPVLATRDGVPLVVQAEYGAGRVLQLAYDPLAEPFPSDPPLRDLAWQQGIGRGLARISPGPNALAPPSQLWSPALEPPAWPSWPRPGLWLLAAYALLALPLAYGLLRAGRRPHLVWVVVPVLSVGVVVAALAGSGARRGAPPPTVEVSHHGPGGTVLTTSYGGRQALGRGERAAPVAAGTAASTVFTPPGLVAAVSPDLSQPAPGGGTLTAGREGASLARRDEPGEMWNLQTVALARRPGVESRLRLVGSGPPEEGGVRIAGTVTNRSPRAVRGLRAQLLEGAVARLADLIQPGESVEVDAPMPWSHRRQAGVGLLARPEELVMFAAASASFTRPGQAVVVGIEEPGPVRTEPAVAVEVVPLGAAERVVAGTGDAHLVSSVADATGARVSLYDLGGVPGIGPLKLAYGTYTSPPEVLDVTTGAWRLLPPGDRNHGVVDTSPLASILGSSG